MAKEVDKFLKDYRQIAKEVDQLNTAAGEKRKKALLAHLDKTWAAEDQMQEAVQKARLAGVQGKKSADFIKQPEVAKTMKPWRALLLQHTEGLKDFEGFCEQAKTLNAQLTKRLQLVEKELKKSGGTGDVKTMATIKEAQRATTELKKSAALVGSLKGHVVMYGANLQRAVDGVVKNALDAVDPKEFPKAFEAENRKRTARILKDNSRKISQLCKLGHKELKGGGNEKLGKIAKGARKLLEELEAINKEAVKVAKTMKKEIGAAKDGKEIAQMIRAAGITYKKSNAEVDALEEEISAAEQASND